MQVSVRELSDLFGFEVTWDAEKELAVAKKKNITKYYKLGNDVLVTEQVDQETVCQRLKHEITLVNGVLYAALDADTVKDVQKLLEKTDKIDDIADVSEMLVDASITTAKAAIKSVDDLKALAKHPEIYADGKIAHIFFGDAGGGFHYRGLSGSKGEILEVTKAPNKYGVYRAKVSINGKVKRAESSFFPDDWTPEQVLDAIEAAYYNGKKDIAKNMIIYEMNSGLKIQVNLNSGNKIISAYPLP